MNMTSGIDFSWVNNQITFAPAAAPTPGSIITAWVTLLGYGAVQLGGSGIGAGEGGWGQGGAGAG
jgi:hypothetical protein